MLLQRFFKNVFLSHNVRSATFVSKKKPYSYILVSVKCPPQIFLLLFCLKACTQLCIQHVSNVYPTCIQHVNNFQRDFVNLLLVNVTLFQGQQNQWVFYNKNDRINASTVLAYFFGLLIVICLMVPLL
jgi:hypothetical protein